MQKTSHALTWLFVVALSWTGPMSLSPERSQAQTAVHVTDEFRRVAREVARRYVAENMKKLCTNRRSGDPTKRFCGDIVAALTELILVATEKSADGAILGDAVEGFGRDLIRSGATLLMEEAIRQLAQLAVANPPAGTKQLLQPPAAIKVADEVIACLLERSLRDGKKQEAGAEASCATLTALKAPATQVAPGNRSKLDPHNSVEPVMEVLQSGLDATGAAPHSPEYQVAVVLNLLGKVSKAFESGAFGAATELASHYDITASQLYRTTYTDDDLLQHYAGAVTKDCSNASAFLAPVNAWRAIRDTVVHRVGRAVATLDPVAVDLELARVSPLTADAGCPAGSVGADSAETLKRAQISYVADARRAAIVGPLIGPLLTAAILVDYLRSRDKVELFAHVSDLTLYAMSAALAAIDESQPARCASTAAGISCKDPAAAAPFAVPEEAVQVVEMRYSPQSGRNMCFYQALAGSIGRPVRMIPAAGYCRTLRSSDGIAGLFPTILVAHAPSNGRVFKWARSVIDPSGQLFTVRLSESERLNWSDMAALIEGVRGSLNREGSPAELRASLALLEAAVRWAEQLQNGSVEQAARPFVAQAATLIKPNVERILERTLVPIESCAGEENYFKASTGAKKHKGMRCALRVLAQAAYDPLVELVADGGTSEARRRAVSSIHKNLVELDALGQTPLLFNVGLGVTALQRSKSGIDLNMTLLDKLGVAYRFGHRNQYEFGAFAGGFLDSLIRELSDSKSVQYWLFGGALGVREFKKHVPLGIELHVAAGVPYNLKEFKDQVSVAYGLALIVPADIAFEE